MNAAFGNNLRQGLLSRRDKIASILEDLEFQELKVTLRTLGQEGKNTLNRWSTLGSLDDWYHKELIEVDNALARIDKGNFGVCLGCGAALDLNWLDAFPEAEFCRNCEELKKWIEFR
jgi:RNA polymerase-binding transcription factor DksA